MIKHLTLPGIALAMTVSPAVAQMADSNHWYLQGFGGANWVDDMEFNFNTSVLGDPISSGNATAEFDTGYGVGGAIGYDTGNFRYELEAAWRDNDIDTISAPAGFPGSSGDISALTFMANAYYDIENNSNFTPYVGAGVGAGRVDASITGPGGTVLDDEGWGFAAQGIAGVSYALTDRLDIFAEGRALAVFEPELGGTTTGANNITTTILSDDDYVSYGAFGGVRYNFGAPPPPAPAPQPVADEPPPAAPEPQDTFIVFFDWDRANLTQQANQVLDEAVNAYNRSGFAQVLAQGHADRSGPADYNVGLSQRRGESVRQGLVARGVAPDEIVVRAFGETQPLVPTPDGVREPQNRRVEIILM
ncbi:MAG: OmpA family protein [Azospirillaceae bacterium]